MTTFLVNGAGVLLAAFIIGWFWLSNPSGTDDSHHH